MRRFGWGNRRFPGFHAIEEIALVIIRAIELDLVFGFRNLLEHFQVRGIEAAAIDPNPAISANPFCAAADIVMSAGDDHRHIVGILAGDAVLGAGVPDGIAWRELAGAFYFGGTPAAVAVKT